MKSVKYKVYDQVYNKVTEQFKSQGKIQLSIIVCDQVKIKVLGKFFIHVFYKVLDDTR